MATVRISDDYQLVIPRAIRKSLHLNPGQKVQVLQYGDRIELIPQRNLEEMRGFLAGIDTVVEREGDRM